MMSEIELVIVDDHALFRRGLISLLADFPELTIVGEASNGLEALAIIEKSKPDMVLLDVNMPVMDGIQTVEALRKNNSGLRILMLTISKNDADLLGAIKAGADGYLLKNSEPDELRRAIQVMATGQSVISPEVTAQVFKVVKNSHPDSIVSPLSDRELEVLNCLARGLTTPQISSDLFISDNTVKTHIRHILEKLEASNRTEAVTKAIQMGLIQKA